MGQEAAIAVSGDVGWCGWKRMEADTAAWLMQEPSVYAMVCGCRDSSWCSEVGNAESGSGLMWEMPGIVR